MAANAVLYSSAALRLAFPFTPRTIQTFLPKAVIGAYLLLHGAEPVYIGRSDHCLRTRLLTHPLLGKASHFVWEPCVSALRAFCVESFWFHRLIGMPGVANMIHPARPPRVIQSCPVCDKHEYQIALRPGRLDRNLRRPASDAIQLFEQKGN